MTTPAQPAGASEPPKAPAEAAPASEQPPTAGPAAAQAQPAVKPAAQPQPEKAKNAPMSDNKKQPTKKEPSEKAFLTRVRQATRATKRSVWTALGFEGEFDDKTFDAKLAAYQKAKAEGGGDDDGAAAEKVAESKQKIVALEAKVAELSKKLAKATKDAEAKAAELEDFKAEHEIREAARSVGIVDADYAVDAFRRHAASTPEGKESPQPSAFFEDLKKDPKRKHLFQAIDVTAGPQKTTQQADGAPAAAPPAPTDGGQPPAVDVRTMSKKDFNAHTAAQYGYRAGA